jgi:hypothetical protein
MASSQNFFVWFCGVLICQRVLIPRRTTSCGVSDPPEQSPAGYQTPRNNFFILIRIFLEIRNRVQLGTIWGRYVEKTGGQKSRATVPLSYHFYLQPMLLIDALLQYSRYKQNKCAVQWKNFGQKVYRRRAIKHCKISTKKHCSINKFQKTLFLGIRASSATTSFPGVYKFRLCGAYNYSAVLDTLEI